MDLKKDLNVLVENKGKSDMFFNRKEWIIQNYYENNWVTQNIYKNLISPHTLQQIPSGLKLILKSRVLEALGGMEENIYVILQASDNPHILETYLGTPVCKTQFRNGCLRNWQLFIETEFRKDLLWINKAQDVFMT